MHFRNFIESLTSTKRGGKFRMGSHVKQNCRQICKINVIKINDRKEKEKKISK